MNFLSHFSEFYTSAEQTSRALTPTEAAAVAAFLFLWFVMSIMLAIITYVIFSWFLGRIFKKAGIPAWIAWVPFYSTWKLLELGGQQGFWAVLTIVPIVNWVSAVFMYIAMYHIGLKMGKPGWWVVLAIFVPYVWLGILAFDQSKWHGPKLAS